MRNIWILLITGFVLASCERNRVYEVNKTLGNEQWGVQDSLLFDFTIADTIPGYDFQYNIRYSASYPYYNLYIRYYLLDSVYNELESRQNNMDLFDFKTGKPLGSGMGDYYDHQILFLQNRKMPYSGQFYIKAVHYMRDEPLTGITSFGVRISKSE